jgi:hypothetical protein
METRIGFIGGLALIAGLGFASPAGGIDTCSAKFDSKTGLVLVKGKGLAAAPTWGDAIGQETNAFYNEATCYDGVDGKIKGCYVADPLTANAFIPPPLCTIYVSDGINTCPARIKGCTPGSRQCVTQTSQVTVASSDTESLTVSCPAGHKVVGGGGSHFDIIGIGIPAERLPLATSIPFSETSWTCAARNETGDASTLSCSVRCCRMP